MRPSRTWGAYWSSVRPEDRESGMIRDRDARLALFSPRFWTVSKENDPFHEPLVTYAYLAGVTKKLGLATGVIILPQRQTVLFAKQAADVDLFSDGRLRLGVGIGWNWVEYGGLEMSRHFRRRGKRQEQQIALIRKPWEQPVVEHETPTTGSTEPGYCRARNGRFRSGSEVSARPHTTGRRGLGTGLCSRAGPKPRRFRSRRGSKPGLSNWAGIAKRSASSPSSNTHAGTTNGPAISPRARCWGEPHIRRDDGREPHHGGQSHRSHQALA